MPQYLDGKVDNFNVEVLEDAIKQREKAKKKLSANFTPNTPAEAFEALILNYSFWCDRVSDRALWLRDRALTHALEFLSEPAPKRKRPLRKSGR